MTDPLQIDRLLNTDKYNVTTLSYPSSVGDSASGTGHYVLFNINVTNGTKLSRSSTNTIDNSDIVTSVRNDSVNPNAGNVLNIDTTTFGSKLNSSVGTSRISTAIALYMPDNITTSYGLRWEQGDVQAPVAISKMAGTAIDAGNGFINAIENYNGGFLRDAVNSIGNIGSKDVMAALTKAGSVAGDAIVSTSSDSELSNYISAGRRELRNPYLEFLFKGMDARTFNFEFKFMPSNSDETEAVNNIIKQFKIHAHPELSRTGGVFGTFYKYPSEFDITLRSSSKQNGYLHKISTCALTNITVNNTPDGNWAAFKENEFGSAPVATTLSLTFTELELLTRERIEDGF